MNNILNQADDKHYIQLISDLKEKIKSARLKAHFAVNKELILLYWNIGNSILERQRNEGWGTKVIDKISADLRKEFPGMRGFSSTNLKYMRSLASIILAQEISPQLVDQIPWLHVYNIRFFKRRCLIRPQRVDQFLIPIISCKLNVSYQQDF